MNKISIVSKTSKGADALQKEDNDRKKMKTLERLQLKALFDVVVSDNPFTITFISKTRFLGYVNPSSLIQSIEGNLELLGCVKGVDFDVILE